MAWKKAWIDEKPKKKTSHHDPRKIKWRRECTKGLQTPGQTQPNHAKIFPHVSKRNNKNKRNTRSTNHSNNNNSEQQQQQTTTTTTTTTQNATTTTTTTTTLTTTPASSRTSTSNLQLNPRSLFVSGRKLTLYTRWKPPLRNTRSGISPRLKAQQPPFKPPFRRTPSTTLNPTTSTIAGLPTHAH